MTSKSITNYGEFLPWDGFPGTRPTNGTSIEFEIRSKSKVLQFKICSTDHNEILHTSGQFHCRGVCKISLQSVAYILNQSTANFDDVIEWKHFLRY